MFVLLTLKWSQVKNPKKIEEVLSKRISLSLPTPKAVNKQFDAKPSLLA